MKKAVLIIAGIGLFFACSKNEIEIQKNTDLSWEIDKKIQENDIRNIIGYDPRFEYVYFTEATTDVPMLSLGDVPLTGENMRKVELKKFDKPATEDIQLTIAYDASLYEKIKDKYSGFELGDASLVKITETTKTLTKGTSSIAFDIVTENDSKLDKKLVIPFSVKTNGENIKGVTGKDYFVVRIFPEKIKITAESSEIEKTFFLQNGKLTAVSAEVGLVLNSSEELPSGLKVGLARNDAALPTGKTLAPANAEGTLKQVDFESTSQEVSFELDLSKFPAELAQYTLPLKWLLYDNTGKSYDLDNNNVLVNISVRNNQLVDNPHNSVGSHDAPKGKRVLHSNITFEFQSTENTGKADKMVDGQYDDTAYFKATNNQYLLFTFDKERVIKSVRFKAKSTHTMGACTIYGYDPVEDEYRTQGTATFTETGGDYTITFNDAISVRYLAIGEFFSVRGRYGAWFEIYEVEFYEE